MLARRIFARRIRAAGYVVAWGARFTACEVTYIVLETLVSPATALRESTASIAAWYVGTTDVDDYGRADTIAVRHRFEGLLS